jgi:hypothetical protein
MGFLVGSPRRRGVGSIIGAAFILLILMTGFSYYTLQFSETRKYSAVLQEMQEVDLRRNSESVDILSVSLTSLDKLNVTVINTGSYQTHLIWIGVHDEAGNTHDYYEVEFFLEPGEVLTDIGNEDITILDGEELLIQLVTEYGNIFTCGYPFDSGGSGNGESGQSTVSIVGMGLPYNPSDYTLLGLTQNVSGSVSELDLDDDTYFAFSSYKSGNGTDLNDFVDNDLSNVDGSGDMGTHSNFQAQRAGPDSMVDVLTEVGKIIYTYQWVTPEGHMDPYNEWSTEVNAYDNNTITCSVNDVKKNKWSGYLVLTLSDAITCGKIRYYMGRETSSIDQVEIDVYNGAWVNVYSGVGAWDAWTNVSFTESSISQMRFRFENIAGVSTEAYLYEAEFLQTIETTYYGLDLEVQWTNVEFDELNEYLCIYCGNMGSEDLRVDIWYNSTWYNIFTDLSNGWNNISVSSYLDSSTFTLRFKDFNDVTDISQDSWDIDASLSHIWSDSIQQTSEVEFTGVSSNETWTALTWMVDSGWNTSMVPVTIQLYDFNTSSYALGGDGYISYVSDTTPDADEQVNQTITSDPTRFRNSTGHWRMRIKGERFSVSQFQMNVDWILFKPRYESSGSNIEYDTWQEYRIRARTGDNDAISYAYTSIYANGTDLMLRNAITKLVLSNPDWLYLDDNGEYYVEVKSSKPFQEQFFIKAVVGSVIGEKMIVQESP